MQFIKGMDVSMAKELEECGAAYYLDGKKEDLFHILQVCGVNMIRLRIWVDPYDEDGNTYGGGANDLETTVALGRRAKENGMELLLDFHYSDFWADPGRQTKPKAWENLSGTQLETAVYLYTRYVLKTLKNHGIIPAMVQIGNEITNGLLWPDGHVGITDLRTRNFDGTVDEHTEKMTGLLKAGMKAAREEVPQAGIILHLDFGTNNAMYREWFDRTLPYGLDYDVIGMSYYPQWNGTQEKLLANLNDISNRYDKDVMVMETAIGYTTDFLGCRGSDYTKETADQAGYPATQEGQEEFLRQLCQTVRGVREHRGIGVFYWEPAWLPVPDCNWASQEGSAYMNDSTQAGNAMANQTLFDAEGNANLALRRLREM